MVEHRHDIRRAFIVFFDVEAEQLTLTDGGATHVFQHRAPGEHGAVSHGQGDYAMLANIESLEKPLEVVQFDGGQYHASEVAR
jgi:hypothetical protein